MVLFQGYADFPTVCDKTAQRELRGTLPYINDIMLVRLINKKLQLHVTFGKI